MPDGNGKRGDAQSGSAAAKPKQAAALAAFRDRGKAS
jgi:hypothetical protein